MARNVPVNVGVGQTGVKSHELLPEWWALIHGGSGVAPKEPFRFPLSGAVAPDQLLPVPFGQVRVGGTVLTVYSPMSNDLISSGFVIVWSEGAISSIDSFICEGVTLAAFTDANSELGFAHYLGNGSAPGGAPYPDPTDVAFTDLQLYRSSVLGAQPWLLLPNGKQNGRYEWAADVHGLCLYDPRLDSTNGGSGAQREATPSTWTYSNNPALIYRYIKSRYEKATMDDVSIAAAATAADTAGFTCNIVFTTKTPSRDAIAAVLQTCNGIEITANGKCSLFLDLPNAGAAVATLSEEEGDIWGLKYEYLSARDRYTRVAVSFANAAANYKQDQTPDFDDPGIALLTVPIRAIVVNAPGINTLDAAIILRDYLFNSQAIRFRLSGTMSARGITLQQGQKVHLVTLKGVDLDCSLIQISGDQSGFFSFAAKPYDANVWGTTPVTQGPPVFPPPPVFNPPPDVLPIFDSVVWPTGFKARWDAPRAFNPPTLYGAAYWSVSAGTHNLARINDGAFVDPAFEFLVGTAVTIAFDSRGGGGSTDRRFVKLRLVYTAATTTTYETWYKLPPIWYSSPAGWTEVTVKRFSYVWIGGVIRGWEMEWEDVGAAQRFWEIRANGALADTFVEAQFIEWDGVGWDDSLVDRYEVHARPDLGPASPADPVVAIIPSSSRPTTANYLNLGTSTYQTGVPSTLYAGALFDFLNACIVTVLVDGRKSAGAVVDSWGYAYSAAAAAGVLPLVDQTAIDVPDVGYAGLAVGLDGKLYKAADGGAWAEVGAGGAGTVTSVGQSVPSNLLAVSGSPITGAGTLALTMPVRVKNTFLGGPATGADAEPAFRALVADDVSPVLPVTTKGDLLGFSTVPARLPVGTNGHLPFAESTVALGIEWRYGLMTAHEIPAGVIDGVNRFFTLEHTPISKRILLVADGMPVVGAVSYGRSGRDVAFRYNANAPRASLLATYPYIGPYSSGSDETLPPGTASTWTEETIGSKYWEDIAWSPELGLFAAIASGGTSTDVATSPDGVTWTARTIPTTPIAQNWFAICWSPERAEFMATGSSSMNVAMRSTDGVNWSQETGTGDFGGNKIIWVPELHLYVGLGTASAHTGAVATSPDGKAWTLRAGFPEQRHSCVEWSPSLGLLVVMGQNHVITSTNGVAWDEQTPPNSLLWHTVAWSPELNLFAAGATAGSGGTGHTYATSPDGKTWTDHEALDGGSERQPFSMVWSRTRLIFVTSLGILGASKDIAASPDGIAWTYHTTPTGMAWHLAVGEEIDTIAGVGVNRTMVSTS